MKEPQDAIVVDEHGNREIKQVKKKENPAKYLKLKIDYLFQVLVNSGCVFVPLWPQQPEEEEEEEEEEEVEAVADIARYTTHKPDWTEAQIIYQFIEYILFFKRIQIV